MAESVEETHFRIVLKLTNLLALDLRVTASSGLAVSQ